MPIPVVCPGCSARFQAPDAGAGRRVPCPKCKGPIDIPHHAPATPTPQANPELNSTEQSAARTPTSPPAAPKRPAFPTFEKPTKPAAPAAPDPLYATPMFAQPTPARPAAFPPFPSGSPQDVPAANPSGRKPAALAPVDPSRTSFWLRHLHWWLALAMLPLAISVFLPDDDIEQRLIATIEEVNGPEEAPPAATGAVANSPAPVVGAPNGAPVGAPAPPNAPSGPGMEPAMELTEDSFEQLLLHLPEHKLKGALLGRDSHLHWLLAFFSAALFMTMFTLLASDKSANPLHLLGLACFTSTAGIVLLLAVQWLAMAGPRIRIRGIFGVISLVLMLIGLSYRLALSPDVGVIPSFLGYTAGVGLCEEICKALPLLLYFRNSAKLNWSGAFLWGLASGAGFGIAEGVMYSGDMYNGISGPMIYAVRFISCVALHAIWTGSVGIAIQQRQDLLQEDYDSEDWYVYLFVAIRLVAIPMVLHGLYDTLLKKDMPLFALGVAGASFGYLAWLVGRLRSDDDSERRAKFVASYIRQRQA